MNNPGHVFYFFQTERDDVDVLQLRLNCLTSAMKTALFHTMRRRSPGESVFPFAFYNGRICRCKAKIGTLLAAAAAVAEEEEAAKKSLDRLVT